MNEMTQKLKKKVKQIFDHYKRKIITMEEFFAFLEQQGYTSEEAKQIYNEASEKKIIDTGLVVKEDEKGRIVKQLVVEYMTEEDWEMIEAVEKETEQEEELKRILHKEPTEEEIKKILKQLNPE